MVTYCVANMIKMCSPMVGQFLLYHDCSIEGLTVAKTTHQNLGAGNCFEQTSIRYLDSFTTSRRSRKYDSEIRQLSICASLLAPLVLWVSSPPFCLCWCLCRTYVQDWTQVSASYLAFSYFYIFDKIVCILVTFYDQLSQLLEIIAEVIGPQRTDSDQAPGLPTDA